MNLFNQALKFLVITIIFPCLAMGDSKAPIKIGWIGPLTGNSAVLGVDTVPAMNLVFERINQEGGINGREIKLVVEDDQYLTKKSVEAYKKLVHQDDINVLVVITYGGLFALSPLAERDNVLLIDPLDCDENIAKLPQNTLCISKLTEDLGQLAAIEAVSRNHTPAGIIYFDGDPFMGVATEASKNKFKELGYGVPFAEGYNDQTSDFKSILMKAKSNNIKSLFFFGYDGLGRGMKQARDLGIQVQFYALASVGSPGFRELAGSSLEGTLIPNWQAPRNDRHQAFLNAFRGKVGREPFLEISTIPSCDIADLTIAGLKNGAIGDDGSVDMPKLREFFYGIKNYDGLSGNITIDPDGITRSLNVKLYNFKDGSIQPAH